MLIERLRLNQFRNYQALELAPCGGVNVIAGNNAQGKTNAVEAVFLCALGRSHRTSRDAELIMSGCAGGYVGASLKSGTGPHLIEIKLREGERKKIFIDRQQAARTAELMGVLNVVMFAPEDLAIVRDGPAERRRFLDMEISQLRPTYYRRLQQYNAALRQRNALLKDPSVRPGMLDIWNEQLASLGSGIMLERCDFMDGLSTIAYDLHGSITGGKEQLGVSYSPSVDMEAPEGVEGALLSALERSAQEDIRRGSTSVGPHRDDLTIKLGEVDVRVYGSQGQKRTAALSLKLSELALLRQLTGEPPVLILDDVMSELDDSRQKLLLSAMQGCQCFLTCTSAETARRAGLTDIKLFRCESGDITEE